MLAKPTDLRQDADPPTVPRADPNDFESIRWFVYVAVGLSVIAGAVGLLLAAWGVYALIRAMSRA
jgi:hypothetical protein